MKEYRVVVKETVYYDTYIYAESADEARELVDDRVEIEGLEGFHECDYGGCHVVDAQENGEPIHCYD